MMDWLAFKTPERLWVLLVLPALIIAYLVLMRLKGRTSLRYTNTGVLGRVIGSQRRWTRHLAVFMSLCSLVALTLAWAQPLGTEKVPRERATVVMVIDTSLSMQASDVDPNRLEAAKTAAKQFVDALPDSYNVALVSLNGSPAVVMPPSTDRGALTRAIDTLELKEGTAIGDALDQALKAVSEAPAPEDGSEPAPAMIVMLSDGGHNVAPDNEVLRSISATTGGESVSADSADSLKDAYKRIGSSVGTEEVKKPVTAQYAFGALGFAVVAALGAVMMAARWPR